MHGDSAMISLSYIAHGFALHPLVSFAGFVALATAGSFHFVWGWARWLGLTPAQAPADDDAPKQLTQKRRWYAINGTSLALAGLWLAGTLGVVGRGGRTGGWIGSEFDELYAAMRLIKW